MTEASAIESAPVLPYSRLPPSELPTLDELGIPLEQTLARPYGRDERGKTIEVPSGPTASARGVMTVPG